MDFNKLKKEALASGIKEIEVYQVKGDGALVSTFNTEVDDNSCHFTDELYIRGVYNKHITSLYLEHDDDSEIESVINTLKSNASVTESNDPYFIYEGDKNYPVIPDNKNDSDEFSQADRIKICQDIEAFLKAKSSYITNTEASIETEAKTISIQNTSGLNVSRKSSDLTLYVSTVVTKDNDVKNGHYFEHLNSLKDIDYNLIYERALKRPLDSIGAKSIKSGHYPVVFENNAFASLVSCFWSMFSGDEVVKKLSLLDGKLGQKVFGDNIVIEDLPLCETSFNKFTFDDEGVSAKNTTVVENGVLKSYLHNLSTAKMLNTTSTGNGFKTGSGNVSVAPTNLCIKCSDTSFDDMIKDIKEGVFITSMMGQHAGVNPVSGAFNLQSSGFMIEDGKITKPVTLIIVSGNIVDVLNNVNFISSDFKNFGRIGTGSAFINSLAISGN